MNKQSGWAELAVLPALIAMAIMLFAAGYTAGKLTMLRMLRADAEATVFLWRDYVADRIGPGFDTHEEAGVLPAGQATDLAPAGVPAQSRETTSDVLSSVILDADGHVVSPDDLRPGQSFAFPDGREQAAFRTMLESGTLQYLIPPAATPDEKRTVFYVPFLSDGEVFGGMRMDVDQTAATSLLNGSYSRRMSINGILGAVGFSAVLIILWHRIRDRRVAEDEIRFLALHDTLTNLPNRARFNTCLDTALERAREHGTTLAVICIDVDNFKDINDTLGHPVGDAVLKSVAERILAASGPAATVARLSGDEFAVFIEHIRDQPSVRRAAERYLRSTAIPHDVDGHELVSTVSIGIALAPADGTDAETLMKNADLALYDAKANGRNAARFFTVDMDEDLRQRRMIEEEMRKGLGNNQFKVFYQPQFDLRSGALTGYEALVRWDHPALGAISPATFIPVAETCGLIVPLGEWVMRTACVAAAEWEEPVKLAVNLSAAQFRTGDVADMIERALYWSRLPPERLEVEITETALLQNTETARATLNRLRDLGVTIAMDDFGTGYSSLSYLSSFPIDKIKIDRSFIQRLDEDQNTAEIVNAIVGLGQSLDVKITAEGVETHEQARYLRRIGCDQAQGFLFGRPSESVERTVPAVVELQESLKKATG